MRRSHAGAAGVGRRRAGGQSMVEYLIVLPTLLLLVLGAVQFALLYQIKSQVNYAAFAAARQGALTGASTNAMKDAFAAGLTPLFTPKADVGGLLRGRAVAAIEAYNPLVTSIKRISPPANIKNDTNLHEVDPYVATVKIIPNDNLQYRPATVGSASGLSIQDVNVLKIEVTYCAKLIVPLANVVFYSVVNGIKGLKSVGGEFFSTPQSVATTPNTCSDLKDKYASKLQTVNDAAGMVGADFSFVQSALNEASKLLSGSIPVLNWSPGGMRIPVVAEAVVRMQTPLKVN